MAAELPGVSLKTRAVSPARVNIASFLPEAAARHPERDAVLAARGLGASFRAEGLAYDELERRSNRVARALRERGLARGDRVCLFVRPGVELVALTFALLKAGAVPVLIDPGMGRRALLACVERMRPRAFIGIPLAHLLRRLFPRAFRDVDLAISVGPRWLAGAPSLEQWIAGVDDAPFLEDTLADEEAAILFTSGSTGPPKGVTYTHGNFHAQVLALEELYGFRDGEVDLACFPLFALFAPALGSTCVVPEMDPSRPASCDPRRVVEALRRSGATTTFGSPAIWRRVVPWCVREGVRLEGLKRVLIAGAPVPPSLIETFRELLDEDADVHTPYGATEALPVSSHSGTEVLAETRALAESGHGTCVGRPAPGIEIALIGITDEVVPTWDETLALPRGEVGEIVVRGAVVTGEYKFQPGPTALAKIQDEGSPRHRMGDVGSFDAAGRLWFLGRKAHRIETKEGLLMPVPLENIFNTHPDVQRTALVGVGERGAQRAVLVVEPVARRRPRGASAREAFARALREHVARFPEAEVVSAILFHRAFPVDVRHNAKIHREELAAWAATELA